MEHNAMSTAFYRICKGAFGNTGLAGRFIEDDGEQLVLSGFTESAESCPTSQARESYVSLVNATNCANGGRAGVLDGYLTLTCQAASYLKSYMY